MDEEAYYRKNANPNCRNCKGVGMMRYHVDQDETITAPCDICFPDDDWAKRGQRQWDEAFRFQSLMRG